MKTALAVKVPASDDRAPQRRPDHVARVQGEAEERVRLLEHAEGHGLRNDPGGGGEEEGRRGAVERAQRQQVPQLRVVRQEQERDEPLGRAAGEAGRDHHLVAREPVGPDPADEQEGDERRRSRREHEPEVALRAGQVDDREREGDRGHRVAEEGYGSAREEQAKLALGERT
jgi:hypothetical protein